MTSPWRRWVAWTSRTGDVRPQIIAQRLACAVLAWDLAAWSIGGLSASVLRPPELGGLAANPNEWYVLDRLVPSAWAGPGACVLAALLYLVAAAGWWVRPAVFSAVLLHAQVGHLAGPVDRGIDQVLRVVLVMLAVGGAPSRCRGWPTGRLEGRLWPADLVRLQLVLMYMGAGMGKVIRDRDWLVWSSEPPLATILADPLVGDLDPEWAVRLAPVFYALGVATILLEVSAFLLLGPWRRAWGLVAVVMHVGIALTLDIGAFSAGLLAIFPVVLMREDGALWPRWPSRSRYGSSASGRSSTPGSSGSGPLQMASSIRSRASATAPADTARLTTESGERPMTTALAAVAVPCTAAPVPPNRHPSKASAAESP
jgi:hypothetical protein